LRISDWSSDVCPSDLHVGERAFPPLGYARAALASYATFRAMKEEGRIAPGTRFQVALPTPFAPMMSFIEPGSFHRIEPLYVAAMHRELDEILSAIPHEEQIGRRACRKRVCK